MSSAEISRYAAELRAHLVAVGAGFAELTNLAVAAKNLADIADGTPSPALWQTHLDAWNAARDAFGAKLVEALLGPLAGIPGVAALAADLSQVAREGIHGDFELGPVRLQVASTTLVVQPPIAGLAPVALGPFPIGQIAATLASPFGGGGGLPGGGSLVRLAGDGGYGGTLQLPLGALQISATAVLAMLGGQPSFLAILGVEFLPPIQLSFGFSLDRVGGLIGINRRANTDALRAAVRTGAAGDVLFAVRPPSSPLALVTAADQLFPANRGTHLIGPSLKLSWLSFGPEGSLVSLNLAVIVELPTGKVVILGVAHVAIPGLAFVLDLRLDVLGIIDPVEQLASVDASLVDSHVLGIFEVYGDAALRLSWGTTGYVVASVGGFFPGFNPEPARLPPLRRVGLAIDNPIPIITVRAEGYFAITSNSIQLGGRWEVGIELGIEAHGFVQVDAIVQFRPFQFTARIAAGFDVSAGGFSFASVTLEGSISGPGPIVIHGALSIDVFLFSISWDETFTLGDGPSDTLPAPPALLAVIAGELRKVENVHAGDIGDAEVVLSPRRSAAGVAAVPPTGRLFVSQQRAPLGLPIDRLDGQPLGGPQGVRIVGGGANVCERFSPGTYITLTDSEALSRPPFELLPAGCFLSLVDGALSALAVPDNRAVRQIVIGGKTDSDHEGPDVGLLEMAALVLAASKLPALSDRTPLITATQEVWAATTAAELFTSASAAHQFVRYHSGVALTAPDAAKPINLAGV